MVRRMLTEPETALAGVILESSSTRFSPSVATFSKERASSRPFGSLYFSAMAETQGGCEKVVRGEGCKEESEP